MGSRGKGVKCVWWVPSEYMCLYLHIYIYVCIDEVVYGSSSTHYICIYNVYKHIHTYIDMDIYEHISVIYKRYVYIERDQHLNGFPQWIPKGIPTISL